MRSSVLISVLSHVVLVALALLGTPKLFDNAATRSIEVDLVRPDEIEPPKEEPAKEQQAAWDPLPDKAEPWPEAARQQEPQPKPDNQQAALAPETQQSTQTESPSPSPAPSVPQQKSQSPPSIFDPANIPTLLNLPNAPDKGFDAEATTTANLSGDERAAFRAQLRKCWKLPGGLSPAQTTRVVLRVYLRRDGALASEPLLIEASASRDGPVLLQAAMRALKDCQPYGFLPADKYSEWKVLDLSFTPRDMAGG